MPEQRDEQDQVCPDSGVALHPVTEPGAAEPFTWVCDMACPSCACDDEWCDCLTERGVFGDPLIHALLTGQRNRPGKTGGTDA